MKEMGWSYEELMNTPYETYLDISRIMSIENKEEEKQTNQMEKQVK